MERLTGEDEHRVPVERRGAETERVHLVDRDDLGLVAGVLQHVHAAVVHRHVEFPVGIGGRGVQLVGRELLAPDELTRRGIGAEQAAGGDGGVDAAVHEER